MAQIRRLFSYYVRGELSFTFFRGLSAALLDLATEYGCAFPFVLRLTPHYFRYRIDTVRHVTHLKPTSAISSHTATGTVTSIIISHHDQAYTSSEVRHPVTGNFHESVLIKSASEIDLWCAFPISIISYESARA